jgi:hypothetical protein
VGYEGLYSGYQSFVYSPAENFTLASLRIPFTKLSAGASNCNPTNLIIRKDGAEVRSQTYTISQYEFYGDGFNSNSSSWAEINLDSNLDLVAGSNYEFRFYISNSCFFWWYQNDSNDSPQMFRNGDHPWNARMIVELYEADPPPPAVTASVLVSNGTLRINGGGIIIK